MKLERPSELTAGPRPVSEASAIRQGASEPLVHSIPGSEPPMVVLDLPARHPGQQSPVAEYQTDRYRLVMPYTRL